MRWSLALMPVLLPALLAPVALRASETSPIDLRVTVLALPESDTVDVTYRSPIWGGGGVSGETKNLGLGVRFEAGLMLRIAQVTPGLALLGGGWAFYGNQQSSEVEDGNRDLPHQTGPMQMTTLGVDFALALSWRMGGHVALECGPFVGVGTASISDRRIEAGNPDGRVEESGNGDYEEVGVALTLSVHNRTRTLTLGLGVRYFAGFGEADFDFDVVDANDEVVINGLHETVEVTLRGFAPSLTLATSF